MSDLHWLEPPSSARFGSAKLSFPRCLKLHIPCRKVCHDRSLSPPDFPALVGNGLMFDGKNRKVGLILLRVFFSATFTVETWLQQRVCFPGVGIGLTLCGSGEGVDGRRLGGFSPCAGCVAVWIPFFCPSSTRSWDTNFWYCIPRSTNTREVGCMYHISRLQSSGILIYLYVFNVEWKGVGVDSGFTRGNNG